jgi:hypothetical protein
MLPMMLEGTTMWLDKYGERFTSLWWFAQGGGVGISEVMDEAELLRMMAEHPFTAYCDVEVQICVDPRTGVDSYKAIVAERMAMMAAAAA